MLTFHKLALTFLLTAGPFRLACHATVRPTCGDEARDRNGDVPACCTAGADVATQARTTRSSLMLHVSHLQATAKASSCDAMTRAPG
jgi:hypothetical protein